MDIEVKMCELAVTRGRANLKALGVGSCLVILLYDPVLGIGGLAHVMLPTSPGGRHDNGNKANYVDTAITEMLGRMRSLNCKRGDIKARIIGGANMFPRFNSDIGDSNVRAARTTLEKEGIQLAAEAIGGSVGRSVEFSISDGMVTIRERF